MKETELYEPVKQLLINQGFDVKAEIKNIDVYGEKEDLSVAVELKTSIQLKLIYQAIDRQKTVDQVYIAIPKSALPKSRSSQKDFYHLIKRLELGLMVVDNDKVEVLFDAAIFDQVKSRARYKKRKAEIQKEFNLRKNDINLGGTNGKKITRYKELVIEIGTYLLLNGPSRPKDIKAFTHIEKTYSILSKNYNRYFAKKEHGIYGLTVLGRKEILMLDEKLKDVSNG